ncbi:MAG: MATE family efflux transporter [Solobacterium sp.]|nr:MATE family efflux transporter [Solobacterium sp.]
MNENRNGFLEQQPLGKLMRKYSVPCIISLLVGALYNIVDQIFIANASYLGSYGNAANTVVYPLTVIALALAVMIGDGACTFVSISLGAKQPEKARDIVGSAVVNVIGISVILMAVYLLLRNPILVFFGGAVNETTYQFAQEYFLWITLGIPAYMFGQAMNPIIRSDGDPRFAMIASTAGAITNIILDPIMIYGFRWGMMGAAVATVLGQVLTAVLSIWYLRHMKTMKLSREAFHLHTSLMKTYIPMGATSFLSQASLVASMAAVNNMVQKYSALDPIFSQVEYSQIPMAVIGIVMKFFQIVISICIGAAAGCAPIAGYNTGAGRHDRVKELFKKLLVLEALVGVVATIIAEGFPKQLIALFGAAHESSFYTTFAVKCFRTYLCMMVLALVNKGAFIYLQSLGKVKESTTISMIREVVFGVGFALLLPRWFGLDGVLYSMPVSDLLTFVLAAWFIFSAFRELDAKMAEGRTETREISSESSVSLPSADHDGVIVVIGRSFGSGGRTVGKAVAEKLGIPYYDKEILDRMAKEEGFLSMDYLEEIDEKPIRASIASGALISDAPFVSMESMAAALQREVIEKIGSLGSCVIVGRNADTILREKHVFSVFVSSSLQERVERVKKRDHVSEEKARERILKADKERSAYYNSVSDKKWGDASSYALCVDTGVLGIDQAVDLIVSAARRF